MESTLTTEPAVYEIIVAERLDARRAGWFAGMSIAAAGQPARLEHATAITGPVADQAALFALISRIRDLGLTLISVNRIV